MLSASEIAQGTQGSLKFLQRDPTALYYFENTPEACLRSFRVMLLVAPFYAFCRLIYYSGIQTDADYGLILLVEGLRYLVDWLLFPVIFYELSRRRGWLERYPRYIGALNWENLPSAVIATVGVLLSQVVPSPFPFLLTLGLLALDCYWFLTTTRMALGADWLYSIALLLINFVPSELLDSLIRRILGIVELTTG